MVCPRKQVHTYDKNKNSSVAVGPGNGETHLTNTSGLFARCCCDAARKARRYCARCKSTAAAAAAAEQL